jgi:5-formyltetrahydrofolate cyclo-ligase
MDPVALKTWRRAERERLVATRAALAPEVLDTWRRRIDGFLERSFRHLARTLRDRGALTALPVVVAPRTPLIFREWHPGVRLERGALDIPYPVGSEEVVPDAVLLPMNGWDRQGYRLGYGAGFFDRTLASLAKKPLTVGISYELAKLDTIHPQSWDLPMDYVVTEKGVYRRDPEGLVFLGEPDVGSGTLSSPVCYADEDYFGRK